MTVYRIEDKWNLGANDTLLNCAEPGCVQVEATHVWLHEDYDAITVDNDIAIIKCVHLRYLLKMML